MLNILKSAKTIAFAAVVGVGLTLSSAANAVTVSFSSATLFDGGVITGTFDFVGGTVSNVSISTTPGSTLTSSQTYTGGALFGVGGNRINFTGTSTAPGSAGAQLAIQLTGTDTFAQLESGAILSAPLQLGDAFNPSNEGVIIGFGAQFRGVSGGLVTVPAPVVPLPAGAPLLVAGLGGLALLRKKRKS